MRVCQNVFTNIKLATDLRLVLPKQDDTENDIFAFLHQMKISYIKDGKLVESFFTLDDWDLDHTIQRLLEYRNKINSRKQLMRNTISILNINNDN